MTPGMRLTLSLVPEGDTPGEFYRRQFQCHVDVEGNKIPYVLCPQTFIDEHAQGSQTGFRDDEGRIYVCKNLHPSEVAMAALYFFHGGLDENQLKERFGEEVVTGLTPEGIEDVILGATLEYAARLLRPKEMSHLLRRFQEDPRNSTEDRAMILRGIAERYLQVGESGSDLVRHQGASERFYVQQVAEYVKAHARNKWVRRSGAAYKLAQGGRAGRLLEMDAARCEPTREAIMNDDVLSRNIPGVVDLIGDLATRVPGDRIMVDAGASKILYLCTGEHGVRKSPVRFLERSELPGALEVGHNIVEIKAGARSFFESLYNRLAHYVVQEIDQSAKALEGIKEIVTRVDAGEQGLAEHLRIAFAAYSQHEQALSGAQGNAMVVHNGGITSLEDNLSGRETDLGLVLTRAPQASRDISRIIRARHLLAGVGVSPQILAALDNQVVDSVRRDRESMFDGVSNTTFPELSQGDK
jgi:hypothetical protein